MIFDQCHVVWRAVVIKSNTCECVCHTQKKYQLSSGLSSSLLMKMSCLRLKLVELNFFASFNADDQRKTYVSDVSKYTFKLSR